MEALFNDKLLKPYQKKIEERALKIKEVEKKLLGKLTDLKKFATGHLYYGLHRDHDCWIFREHAPNATEIHLVGDFSFWGVDDTYKLYPTENGNWEIKLPLNTLKHLQFFKLLLKWNGGEAYRLPSYANRVVYDPTTNGFNAQIWNPENPYLIQTLDFKPKDEPPMIYEAHIGMASEEEKVASYRQFIDYTLPRIKNAGYNTIQLMAIQEHPYYGSFGYHVANFFAASSKYGNPDELKELVDTAHNMGIAVIMDIVHSHSVKNAIEGLALFDGTPYLYFHKDKTKRDHPAWDSLCFNYGKPQVMHFLLSNCQYWLTEYGFDGFRFDGVTSMLYFNHGLGCDFNDYSMYYDGNQDEDAIVYLALANKLIHNIKPNAITVAEEMSGMPGIAANIEEMGYGFDYRLSMGTPDYWIRLIKEIPFEKWHVGDMFYQLNSHRQEEKTISYAESHDQALVGDQTIIFRLLQKKMYTSMSILTPDLIVDNGIAIHKIIRLITIATSAGGYLNFMGNEFGHPEWIDFPRIGNNWSYKYARRQWHLQEDDLLKYKYLSEFDRDMINLIKKSKIYQEPYCYKILDDPKNQVLVFRRGEYLFVFNFSPTNSYTDYLIPMSGAKFKIALCSDDNKYGGFNRVNLNQEYQTISTNQVASWGAASLPLYIPTLTAIVIKKIEAKKAF